MATRFKTIQRPNPQDVDAEKLHYATLSGAGVVGIKDLIRRMSRFTSLSEPDIRSVLLALRMEIQESLLDGKTVRLDEFGTFRMILKSTGCATAEEVCRDNIKGVKLHFIVGKDLRKTMADLMFEKHV